MTRRSYSVGLRRDRNIRRNNIRGGRNSLASHGQPTIKPAMFASGNAINLRLWNNTLMQEGRKHTTTSFQSRVRLSTLNSPPIIRGGPGGRAAPKLGTSSRRCLPPPLPLTSQVGSQRETGYEERA